MAGSTDKGKLQENKKSLSSHFLFLLCVLISHIAMSSLSAVWLSLLSRIFLLIF